MIVALLLVPLLGAAALGALALRPSTADGPAPRWTAVAVAAVTFGLSLALLPGTRSPAPGLVVDPRHEVDVSWIAAIDVRFHVGVDGTSLPLVVLTALLTLLCTISTVRKVPAPGRAASFNALVLLLEVGLLGTFVALDLVLFFVAFEIVLAPMYFLIALWGGGARARHAATKFVLYTLLGSVFVVIGILTVYASAGTFDVVELSERGGAGIAHGTQVLAFAALFAGFAVKSPLWPVHTWLPDAHTEAPTVGSVLLAGALLKMGTYGLVRVALPVLPEGARTLAPLLGALAVAGIVVGALCCLVQTDVKRLIAYSSVGHMGFVLLGIATLTPTGVNAALLGNIAHGLITGLLFFLVGGIKDRYGTAELRVLGSGLAERLPRLGALFVFASVASLGLPGLAGFWGEAFSMQATLRPAAGLSRTAYTVLLAVAAAGTAITAAYFLRLLRALVLGPLTRPTGGGNDTLQPRSRLRTGQPTGGGLVVADTTEAPDSSSALPSRAPARGGAQGGRDRRPHPPTAEPEAPGPGVPTGDRQVGAAVDVRPVELAAWAPLVVLTLVVGLYPRLVLGLTEAPVQALLGAFS